MAEPVEKNLDKTAAVDGSMGFLDLLGEHKVNVVIFDPEFDDQWIEFFWNQQDWCVEISDDEIVSFKR